MPVKTILVHLANDDQSPARLSAAAGLARRLSAHLTALYVTTPAHMPAAVTGRGASSAYLAEATAIAQEKAEKMRGTVIEAMRREGMSIELEIVDGEPVEAIASESRFADIAIVGQSPSLTLDSVIALHPMEDLPLATACPCLVLPHGITPSATIGRRVVLGWKDTRTTARAMHDAVPMLESAESVLLLAIHEDGGPDATADAAAAYLARHGIPVEVRVQRAPDGDAGPTLIAAAAAAKADMLVMGAFGHSRWREIVFGGATNHVIRHMTVPVLFAH